MKHEVNDGLNIGRRKFLVLVAATTASVPAFGFRAAQAAELPHLSADDSSAKQLNYVDDATQSTAKKPGYKSGNACANCALYQGDRSKAWGPCATFPGAAVNTKGWCIAYAPA